MALPRALPSTARTESHFCGPFLSSGGDHYVVGNDDTNDILNVHKSANPDTTAFVAQDTAGQPNVGFEINDHAATQVGDTLYIAHIHTDTSGMSDVLVVEYHVFSLSSDTWTTVSETVHGGIADNDFGLEHVAIATRTGSDTNFNVVVAYTAPADASMGTDYARISYKVRNGTWGSEQSLDNGGNDHWGQPSITPGSADRLHFLFGNYGTDTLYQRTLTSGDSLESIPSGVSAGLAGGRQRISRGVTYDDSGTQRCRAALRTDGTPSAEVQRIEFDSADTPGNPTLNEVTSTSADAAVGIGVAGTDLYVFFAGTDSDLFYDKNDTTDVEHRDGEAVSVLSVNVFERSGNYIVGIVWWDAVAVVAYYDEFDAGPTGAVAVVASKLALLGVGI